MNSISSVAVECPHENTIAKKQQQTQTALDPALFEVMDSPGTGFISLVGLIYQTFEKSVLSQRAVMATEILLNEKTGALHLRLFYGSGINDFTTKTFPNHMWRKYLPQEFEFERKDEHGKRKEWTGVLETCPPNHKDLECEVFLLRNNHLQIKWVNGNQTFLVTRYTPEEFRRVPFERALADGEM